MRRRSALLSPRRSRSAERCGAFWPRVMRDAAAMEMQLALERLESDIEAVQKAGRLHPDTRVALKVLCALAEMDSEIAGYVESAVVDLPVDIRAVVLDAAARFLTAQTATIDRVRSRVLIELT